MSLAIEHRSVGEITVVTCTGRIVEGDEATTLESRVKSLFPMQRYIVLDLAGIAFIDSCGVGLLIRLRTFARAALGDLKLCAANRQVREVLRVTRLDRILAPFVSELEAVTAFYTPAEDEEAWAAPEVDVLCVHSSLDVLAYARELIKQAGYGVSTASNVSDARVLLRATKPPTLIIDADLQARLAALIQKDVASELTVIGWPSGFSTDDPGDAARELLSAVNRAFAEPL